MYEGPKKREDKINTFETMMMRTMRLRKLTSYPESTEKSPELPDCKETMKFYNNIVSTIKELKTNCGPKGRSVMVYL